MLGVMYVWINVCWEWCMLRVVYVGTDVRWGDVCLD